MIGKLARMLAGRSVAKKRGYGAGTGALVGLLAPFVISKALSLIGKAGSAAADKRRLRKGPDFGPRLGSTEFRDGTDQQR